LKVFLEGFWQISRGKTFTFGLHVIVLKCNSPILRGPNCNITVTQLCSYLPIDHLYTTAWHPSDGSLHEELKHHDLKPLSGQDHSAFLNDANWVVLKDQNIQPGEWKYYSLDVPQYYLKLDIITVVSPMAFKSDMGLNKLYQSTRYGALPEQSQGQMHLSLNALTIDVPKHGLWYIGVFNPVGENFMGMINFNLYWRIESCNTKTQGTECKATLIPLEVRLTNQYLSLFLLFVFSNFYVDCFFFFFFCFKSQLCSWNFKLPFGFCKSLVG
jgi:hypothetical protein